MIIASAIKVNKDGKEFVIIGKRHCLCFETMFNAGIKRPFKEEQGFINDQFEFMNRQEAYKHAIECSQIENSEFPGILFSEDIFPPTFKDDNI